MAIKITTRSPLPKVRIGKEYPIKLEAEGGAGTPVWSVVGGALPTGLTLNTDGTFTGPATVCGDFTFTAQVVDGETTTKAFFITASTLPSGWDVQERLAYEGEQGAIEALDPIMDSALAWLSARTGIPFTNCTKTVVVGECPALDEKRPGYVWPALFPVASIQRAQLGNALLTVGTIEQFRLGRVQVAIGEQGFTVLHRIPADRGAVLVLDYTAGMSTLPTELVEVAVQYAMLVFRKTSRVGVESSTVAQATMKYTDKIPPELLPQINRWRRLDYAF